MDDLISRKQTIKALEEWEKIYTWDDWCRMHNDRCADTSPLWVCCGTCSAA